MKLAITLIMITMCLFIVVGCSNEVSTQELDVSVENTEEILKQELYECQDSDESNAQCRYKYYTQMAMETEDLSHCVTIHTFEGAALAEKCYAKMAYVTNDPSLCEDSFEKISSPGCFTSLAILSEDYSICQELDRIYTEKGSPDGKIRVGQCYNDYAAYYADADVCALIEYDRDPSPYMCYIDIAENHGDAQVCDKIENALKEDCQEAASSSTGLTGVYQHYQEFVAI